MERLPLPEITLKFTVSPATGLPPASVTKTSKGWGSGSPAAPVWLFPEYSAMAAAAAVTPVAGDQIDEIGQVLKVRAQINVHIRHDVRVAFGPGALECQAASFDIKDERADGLMTVLELAGEFARAVIGTVVGDDQAPIVARVPGKQVKRGEDALLEHADFVVAGDHHVNA